MQSMSSLNSKRKIPTFKKVDWSKQAKSKYKDCFAETVCPDLAQKSVYEVPDHYNYNPDDPVEVKEEKYNKRL